MVLVDGSYCPNVRQECLRYLDPPGRYGQLRCAEFRQPASCVGERQPMRYCIDREEFTDPGEVRPRTKVSWTRASEVCRERGARLCRESEWQFACEGEEMRPYPYGFSRDSSACNIDQTKLGRPEQGLNDLRAPVSEYPRCVSPFGVHDLTGNVDEWTERADATAPNRSVLHGGWWLPARNACRAATSHHNEAYFGPQVGFRCCKDSETS
jgi:formylglycine-generating enzyme required for sulfatase activity